MLLCEIKAAVDATPLPAMSLLPAELEHFEGVSKLLIPCQMRSPNS